MPSDPTRLPGWRWMAGMRTKEVLQPPPWTLPLWDEAVVLSAAKGEPVRVCTVLGKVRDLHPGAVPDPTDPATGGCLLALLGLDVAVTISARETGPLYRIGYGLDGRRHATTGYDTLGAACIAVAVALGRWPGGGE